MILPDRYAGDARGLSVATYRHHVAPVARAVEDDPADDRDRDEDVDGCRDSEDPAVAEPEQRERAWISERAAVEVQKAHGQLVVQKERKPPGNREHRERGDERHDSRVGDGGRVDGAEHGREGDRAEDEDEAARAVGAHQDPAEDARGRDHRADRQVDAGRCDHEGHADREHADDARLGQHVAHVVPGRERLGLQDRPGDEEQDDDAGERVFLHSGAP